MEQRTKDIEDALGGIDAIDPHAQSFETDVELWNQAAERIETGEQQRKSVDLVGKQKNMYRALGINPAGTGL